MIHRQIALATLLVAALGGVASAASSRNPGTDPDRPGPETRPITSPGDPFHPPVSNAPTGNADFPTYPKLICYFEIVGDQVIIHWINVGTAPAPAGAKITGTTSGGIGLSSFIPDSIPPGGKHSSQPLDMNPAWFNEACNATITY